MPDSPSTFAEAGIISKSTSRSVADAVTFFTELVNARGMMIFTIIDHSGEAKRHGLELRTTQLVIFGSPVGGTPVMEASPLAALDLPLKILVWDNGGQTTISYTDPEVLTERHHLNTELASRLAGIGPLTDALVA
jgi:uncharacterized protein (DUF302 family)